MIYRGTLNAEDKGTGSFETSRNTNLRTQRHITDALNPLLQRHIPDALNPLLHKDTKLER
jgi:hypothetical protein